MKKINVLYQTDNNYAAITGVSIISLLENNQHLDITLYILDDNISEENKKRLKSIETTYKQKIIFVNTQAILNKIKSLKLSPHKGTYTTYFKLFVLNHLQFEGDLVLQIDGDTIINAGLEQLCELNLKTSPFAACYENTMIKEYKKLIGLAVDDKYYNCGVLLFSITNWKKLKCEEKIINHLQTKRNKYFIVDQDILNVLFGKKIKILPATYNFDAGFYLYGINNVYKIYGLKETFFYSKSEIKKTLKQPIINHCGGTMTGRPWEKDNIHPQKDLYDKYLKISPWRGIAKQPLKLTKLSKAQQITYKYLPLNIYVIVHRIILKNWLKKMNNRVMSK